MTLKERLAEHVAAGFSGIWIESTEHEDALLEIAELSKEQHWRCASWDVDQGVVVQHQDSRTPLTLGVGTDPLAAIRAVAALATPADPDDNGDAGPPTVGLLVLKNLHRPLNSFNSAEIVQAVDHQIASGKRTGAFLVALSPVVQIPIELEKQFIVLEHDLPGREQLRAIAQNLATEPGDLPTGPDLERLLDAAAGLTRYEAEGAFSLSLVRKGRIDAEAVWELKSQALKKSGLLQLHRGGESFADLGGLEALKQFCLQALRPQNRGARARPRGILLLGMPGSGKSAFAKALGNETGRPTLTLDVGALMGSLVGQTEGNVRKALKTIDAMAPCICFLDEIEKALSGTQGGANDSGVSTRLFGSLLTWLNDHTSDVFFIATSNDVSKLPPEFSRAERFDGVFFLDLPGAEQKAAIWRLYRNAYAIERNLDPPDDTDWTGAEIKACCRLAALLGVPLLEAARHIVPVAVTASESVERLRSWASCRCLSAETPGIYNRSTAATAKRGRQVRRDVSMN